MCVILNGMLLEIKNKNLRTVTDGHRLATCVVPLDQDIPLTQVIIPRKAVLEMLRLLEESDQSVVLTLVRIICALNCLISCLPPSCLKDVIPTTTV